MKQYIKILNGQTIIEPQSCIVVKLHGKQYINPSESLILQDGWQEYTEHEEETLESVIATTINNIKIYDSSSEINTCYIVLQDRKIPYWANKTERSVLKTSIQDCLSNNRNTYRLDLRDANISINIDCHTLLQMLSILEVYAIDCYNKTTDHIFAVKNLKTIEEVKNYNYTIGYPEKPIFTI